MSTATAFERDAEPGAVPLFEPSREFVDGVWMERTMGNEVAEIANEFRSEMVAVNRRYRLGRVVGPDSGFQYTRLAGGARRHPDAAFIRNDQVPSGKLSSGWDAFAPALVVEVVSPHDTAGEVARKVLEWLAGGVELLWVIYPETREVAVHYPDRRSVTLCDSDILDGEDIFPGFHLAVAGIFAAASGPS